MAIPYTLKQIDEAKAKKIIEKHTKDGTGQYEYPNEVGDFVYKTGKGWYLIREFLGKYETGRVVL